MRRWIQYSEDFLEIILNFMVVLCLETAADASFGGMSVPVWKLALPVFLPFFFYALRKWAGKLLLFLILHLAAAALLFTTAGNTPFPLLWKIVFAVIGAAYSLHSVKVRVTGDDIAEGEMPAALAGCLAVASFFICSYMRENTGCERITWLTFVWLTLYLLKNYLGNFQAYIDMNKKTSGVMPEDGIFRAGIITAGGYSCLSVLLLILCAQTPLVGWLSEIAGKSGRLLLRLLFMLVTLFAGGEGETGPVEEEEIAQMTGGPEASIPPAWLQVLDTIVRTAAAIALIAGIIALIVLFARYLIRNFYGRKKEAKEICGEGFLEEEERLGGIKKQREKKLPLIGGTVQQRVRKLFKKTVQEAYSGEPGLHAMTAREIAGLEAEWMTEEWELFSDLYERARYAQGQLTWEDVKAAGKLSREIVHNIK